MPRGRLLVPDGDLPVPVRRRILRHPPRRIVSSDLRPIEDAAAFYSRVAKVSKEQFLSTAKSFSVVSKMQQADLRVKSYPVHETPTVIVNGKYRLSPVSAGSAEKMIELVKWLVAKETR